MPVLHVEAVPADLYERIRRRAAARNQEFSTEVLRLLELALAEEDEARTAQPPRWPTCGNVAGHLLPARRKASSCCARTGTDDRTDYGLRRGRQRRHQALYRRTTVRDSRRLVRPRRRAAGRAIRPRPLLRRMREHFVETRPAVGASARQGGRDIQKLCTLRLNRTPTADLATDALQIALAHVISAYDACYVALSRRLGLPLITADDALLRKLASSPFAVKRLADLSFPPTP